MPTDPTPITRFARNEDGAVAVVVSLLLTVILGFVAFGIDIASLYRDRAELQAVSDLTAMTSVADHDEATARATLALTGNARQPEALHDLQTGRFLRNPAVPRDQRFSPLPAGSPGINAVQVVLKEDAPIFFGTIFTDESHVGLTSNAMATRTGAASFTLTSHVAKLSATSLNDLLFDRFGVSAGLTAGDIEVLAQAEVNMGDLLTQLAQDTGLGAANPAEILNLETTVGQVLSTLQSLLPAAASGPLASVSTGTMGLSTPVADLIGGIDTDLGLTVMEFTGDMEISALDVLKALASADTSEYLLDIETGAAVPGLLSTSTRLAAGPPPSSSGWVALGEEGVQLHTAAVRMQTEIELNPNLLGSLGVGVSVTALNLPIYTEIAGAAATLEEINCNGAAANDLAARFSTARTALHPTNGTAVAALYLGALSQNAFETGPIDPANLDYADLLDIDLVIDLPLLPDIEIAGITLQARSHVAVGHSQVETIAYTRGDVANGDVTRTFGSGDLLGSAVNGLLSPANTDIRVKPGQEGLIAGLAAPLVDGVLAALPDALLAALVSPLDAVLDDVLDSIGLQLGAGELTLTGHHCEPVRLIQ